MRKGIIALILAMAIVALSGAASAWTITGDQTYCFTDAKTVNTPNQVLYTSSAFQDLKANGVLRAEADLQNWQSQYYNPTSRYATVATAAIQTGESSISVESCKIVDECDEQIAVDKFTFSNEIQSAVHFQALEGTLDSAVSDLTQNAYSKGTAYTDFAKITEVDSFVGSGSGTSGVSWIKAGNMWVNDGTGNYVPSVDVKEGTLGYKAGSEACVYKEGNTDDLALISASAWVGGDVLGKALHLNDPTASTRDFAGVFISGDFQWDARLDQDPYVCPA
jgi:hypothetical protein